MSGDKAKVMKFLVENMEADAEVHAGNANPPEVPKTCAVVRLKYEERDVTEQQMICEFVRRCGIGRGSKWKGVIIMPTSNILVYMRNLVHDILHLHLQLGDVIMQQTAGSTIVVKWHSGEELRLEACHCAIALQHLRGCRFQYLGIVHGNELSERTKIVARTLMRPYGNEEVVNVYEA